MPQNEHDCWESGFFGAPRSSISQTRLGPTRGNHAEVPTLSYRFLANQQFVPNFGHWRDGKGCATVLLFILFFPCGSLAEIFHHSKLVQVK
jgi:hypothetical protein